MPPRAAPEGGPEAFAVAEAVFPGAGTGGRDDLDQHTVLEDRAEAEFGEERGGEAEVLDADDVEEVEHPVHAEAVEHLDEAGPVDFGGMGLNVEAPVQHLAQAEIPRDEMGEGVLEEEERVQIRQREIDPLAGQIYRMRIILRELLQNLLEGKVGLMVIGVDEGVVVVHQELPPAERGVMMAVGSHIYPPPLDHRIFHLLGPAECPEVYIPARAMLRPRPIQGTRISLQNHHPYPLRG